MCKAGKPAQRALAHFPPNRSCSKALSQEKGEHGKCLLAEPRSSTSPGSTLPCCSLHVPLPSLLPASVENCLFLSSLPSVFSFLERTNTMPLTAPETQCFRSGWPFWWLGRGCSPVAAQGEAASTPGRGLLRPRLGLSVGKSDAFAPARWGEARARERERDSCRSITSAVMCGVAQTL